MRNEPPFAKVARGPKGIAAYFTGCDLAGYNIINFDIPMLAAELERAGERLDVSGIAVIVAESSPARTSGVMSSTSMSNPLMLRAPPV